MLRAEIDPLRKRAINMASAATWSSTLRKQLKNEHGFGWTVEQQSEKVKLVYRRPGARKQSITLQIPWNRSCGTSVLNAVSEIRLRMEEQNLSLAESHSLIADSPVERSNGPIDWEEVARRYEDHRVGSGTVKLSNFNANERPRITRCIELLTAARSVPTDGRSLMKNYAHTYICDMPTGSDGRRRNLDDVARFLDFAVRKCGAGSEWCPMETTEKQELVGSRIEQREQTIPVKPEQLQWLLEALDAEGKRPDLRLAIALVGLFGLRPAELGTLEVRDGRLYVGPVKRNRAGAKKSRLSLPLDLSGMPGEGERVLQLFDSGLVKLPVAIRNQIAKATPQEPNHKGVGDEFRQQVQRCPHWQTMAFANPGLIPYSLRHGYAWRGHKAYERSLPVRDLAALMGHTPATHHKHYGQWVDEEGLRDAVARLTKTPTEPQSKTI